MPINLKIFQNIKLKKISLPKKKIIPILVIIVIVTVSLGGTLIPFGKENTLEPNKNQLLDSLSSNEQKDENKYTAFYFEIYDLIMDNYWNKLSEEQLNNLSQLAIANLIKKEITSQFKTKAELRSFILETMNDMSDEEKKDFIVNLSNLVLANLEPFARSGLYTQSKQQELINTVTNVNPDINHYSTLGIEKEAQENEIRQAYASRVSELNQRSQTEETKQELAQVNKAFEVLSDSGAREIYDQYGADPTITGKLLSPRIYYVKIEKFSPITVQELDRVMSKVDQGTELDTLIIDIRSNIGGAIDGLPHFLGPFIGYDKYAYQFFGRGQKKDFKTVTGWLPSLVRYKSVVVLTDGLTQSSGEVFASVLKNYNVGILVGETTRGWGTVESIYKINNQIDPDNEIYSAFIVHHLTLRDDGQTIQDKGVEPHVNIKDQNWEQEFNRYNKDQELLRYIKELVN